MRSASPTTRRKTSDPEPVFSWCVGAIASRSTADAAEPGVAERTMVFRGPRLRDMAGALRRSLLLAFVSSGRFTRGDVRRPNHLKQFALPSAPRNDDDAAKGAERFLVPRQVPRRRRREAAIATEALKAKRTAQNRKGKEQKKRAHLKKASATSSAPPAAGAGNGSPTGHQDHGGGRAGRKRGAHSAV